MGIASLDTVSGTLSAFRLPESGEWRLLPRSAVKRDEMVRVAFTDNPPVLIRFHDPEFYLRSDIEQQARFRSHLGLRGVPVPVLYRDFDGNLVTDVYAGGEMWAVTVEQWIAGEPPQSVTPPLVSLMGTTLGKMHLAAESSRVAFGHGTDMSLFGPGEEYARNASRLRASLEPIGLAARAEDRLLAPWSLSRQRLGAMWAGLPRGPVHADFAEYNVLLDETENLAAVIDFNLCGDDVFVNELVHACLWLPSSGDDELDRSSMARFLNAYETVRPLSASERLSVPYLISIIRPFRWREVRPLVRAAERGDSSTALRHLARLERLMVSGRLLG